MKLKSKVGVLRPFLRVKLITKVIAGGNNDNARFEAQTNHEIHRRR